MMHSKKSLWSIIIFNALYIIPFFIYYLSIKDFEFIWYIVVLVIVGLAILTTLKYTGLDKRAMWGLSIWGLLHMMGGGLRINGSSLYSQHIIELINRGGDFYILKMDQVIHFYGFAVAALVVYQLIAPHLKHGMSRGRAIFIAWIGSMGLGALNEVIEFLAFITLSQTGVGDVYNTGFDLIFNLLGALAGSFLAAYWYRLDHTKGKHKS